MSEIGVFLKQVIRKNTKKKADDLYLLWLANNIDTFDHMKEEVDNILNSIGEKNENFNEGRDERIVTPEKARSEFKRLQKFMMGLGKQ